MKVLYVAYKHDPLDQDAASGSDFGFHGALVDAGFEVKVAGPFYRGPTRVESLIKVIYERSFKRRFLKYPILSCLRTSWKADEAVRKYLPDAVFTIFPNAVAFMKSQVTLVTRLDTTFLGQQHFYPIYGRLPLRISAWQERRAFRKSSRIITQSLWSKRMLENLYGVDDERVTVFPNPAAIPASVVPDDLCYQRDKCLDGPLRLLFVGREAERKGLPVAIGLVEDLSRRGVSAHLKVCGLSGPSSSNVHYVGLLKKKNPSELRQYVDLYREAHFLVHPAKFEAAGIVPSEAAAFGTPTITNDSGGLGTTVKDGVSGVVLPARSPSSAYAESIIKLVNPPDRYYELCQSTRKRYDGELNWSVAKDFVAAAIREAAQEFESRYRHAV